MRTRDRRTRPRGRLRARAASGRLWLVVLAACVVAAVVSLAYGCSGWEPTEPFVRNSPEVDRALALMDGGQFESAEQVLEAYLATGACGDAGIGLPPSVREKSNGSFDLGLTLFHLAERYGQRFGDEELADGGGGAAVEQQAARREIEIECAQIIVKAIASDPTVPPELRARAYYLSGNLEFLRREYEQAVRQYDQCLQIVPGIAVDASGDAIGRDAAWNRAIALRRIQEQDAGTPDAQTDAPEDQDQPETGPDGGGEDAGEDAGNDGSAPDAGGGDDGEPDGGAQDEGAQDGGADDGGAQDRGSDAGEPPPADEQPDRSAAAPMERLLDELEEVPTYQEEEAKKRIGVRRRFVMEDK